MEDSGIDEPEVYAVEKTTPDTEKSDKVKQDNGLSQLRDDESLGTIGEDMDNLHDEAVREETLDKDQVEGNGCLFCHNSLLNLFRRFWF